MILDAVLRRCGRWIKNDKLYLSLRWWCRMGYCLDWEHPQTFCEKIQWLKLYNRKPEYTNMVDKYAVKEYVAGKIGLEHIIPTLGVWDKPEDIDWDSLPDQFVLKTTHGGGGGGVVICKDKQTFNKTDAIEKLARSLAQDIYMNLREWPYKGVPKRIIAEKYLEERIADNRPSTSDLTDYKFYCFNGEPRYCQVIRDRHMKETIDFYDMNWNHMPFYGLNPVAKNGLNPVAKPVHLEIMIDIARKLSKGMPFARIDLYEISNKEYFGEITLYPASGLGLFTPIDWNTKMGELITLPITTNLT